ncbi:hypothetical protein V6Z11_A06G059100 [Gossypium hirsutum]
MKGREGNDAHNASVLADFGVHRRLMPSPPPWHQSETSQNAGTGVLALGYGGLGVASLLRRWHRTEALSGCGASIRLGFFACFKFWATWAYCIWARVCL